MATQKPSLLTTLAEQKAGLGYRTLSTDAVSWMQDFSSYAAFLEFLGNEKRLKGYRHEGVHITVNTFRELEDAEQNIHEFLINDTAKIR